MKATLLLFSGIMLGAVLHALAFDKQNPGTIKDQVEVKENTALIIGKAPVPLKKHVFYYKLKLRPEHSQKYNWKLIHSDELNWE